MSSKPADAFPCAGCARPSIEWCGEHSEWYCVTCLFAHPCRARAWALRGLGPWGEALILAHKLATLAHVARDVVACRSLLSLKQVSRAAGMLDVHSRALALLMRDERVSGHARYGLLMAATTRISLARKSFHAVLDLHTSHVTKRKLGQLIRDTTGHQWVTHRFGVVAPEPEPWRIHA